MKWIYKKPMIFPQWTKFKGNEKNEEYYSCENDGIVFSAESGKLSHSNHIEMAGFETSSIISYKIDNDKKLTLYRFCVFPQIRVACLKNCGMSISEMKEYLALCLEGLSTINERKVILKRKKEALLDKMAELQKSIDFIDWKQNFYDDVLLGKTEYISNLIDTNNPDQ